MSFNQLLFPDEIICQILTFLIPKSNIPLNSEIQTVNNFYLINKQFNKCTKIIIDSSFYKELLFTTYLLGINNELKQKIIDMNNYKTIYFHLNQYQHHLQQQFKENKTINLKIGLFGKDKVGKTSIEVRFLFGSFIDHYGNRELYIYIKPMVIEGKNYSVNVFDTQMFGQNDFEKLHYIHTDCFLIVCDLTNLKTLQQVEDIIEFCYKIKKTKDVPIVIVGNKLDLIENKEREIKREMVDELIEKVSKTSNLKPIYLETSAKTGINIDKVFYNVVKLFKYKSDNWFNVVERLLNGEEILKDLTSSNKKCITM
ncbi:hypothetical protein ABK040_002164 [Willaertia magna]